MKDLGTLHHFVGVTVDMFLHQRQYTLDILERAGMTDCNPCSTPVDTQAKLFEDVGALVADPTAYRSLTGVFWCSTVSYFHQADYHICSSVSRFAFICMAPGATSHYPEASHPLPPWNC
jgi:hypothetical protein